MWLGMGDEDVGARQTLSSFDMPVAFHTTFIVSHKPLRWVSAATLFEG